MTTKDKPDARILSGCVAACWRLFLTIPLFCALMYGLVASVNPPQWVWIVFWIYVPVCIIGGMFSGLVKVIGNSEL